ncbi:MAG TPA: NAD(P)/FAD-dependent oxidoreductase [Dokdonella sp.]|uniref:NAD(P)/FAD-dependent oxidoreductase n=1 Tax=Dokdonella sp. TaxID=2291710 RepID=UPI002BA4F776|nr:NAD(P)/FAD-dependent oxidoreductase [Dokdonella sp.]HOX71146.1 NAD(P)/FAD-dependent oxidoreductase [Dokdonella sp.]
MHSKVDCDVLVIGGGPAGSSAATVLARNGWRVLLLEKDKHPRFHIGESLLPCNLPIFEQLGVLEKVSELGVLKLGADFPSDPGNYQTFHFRRALGNSPPHAFQVKREEFDRMLFEHAREAGVDAREQVKVEEVTATAIDAVSALARDAQGNTLEIGARYLVDASGRDTVLGNKLKLKRKNEQHQSAAIFAHFLDVERRPGEDAGNISIYNFDHGWCWFIPLRDGVMSVGCVCWPEYLKQRKGDNEGFLINTLKLMPEAWGRMQQARMTGEVRVTGNYSYTCSRMSGPGWIMAGDAWAFVDPVFSSGVYLAMHGGTRAAEVVNGSLRDPRRETGLQRAFAKRVARGVKVFSWFIYRFNSPIMRGLFAHPRNYLRVEEGVISMLAGDVFESRPVMLRVHLFRLLYATAGLLSFRKWRSDLSQRRRQARSEFSGGTTPVDPA